MRRFKYTAFFCLGAALLTAAPETGRTLTFGEREFTCPIDGRTFTARVVQSHSQFGMRLDLRPLGALVAPMPLPVCPGNGFVMYKIEFTEAEVGKLKTIVGSEAFQQARPGHTDYYMAAFIKERMGAPDYDVAWTYLHASWEAENVKRERLAEYLALAVSAFDKARPREQQETDRWWAAHLVAADLERRLGRFTAVDQRLDVLPLATLPEQSPVRLAAQQIRAWNQQRNTEPQEFAAR